MSNRVSDKSWSKSERRKRAKSCDDPQGFTMRQFCRNQRTRSGKGERTNEVLLRHLIREELLSEAHLEEPLIPDLIPGTNQAPFGLLVFGGRKALVGDNHETPINLSEDLFEMVVNIGKKHGFYGEGVGYERNPAVTGSAFWPHVEEHGRGSWDALVSVDPEERWRFLYSLFSNISANKRLEKLMKRTKRGDTIRDLLRRTHHEWAATKGTKNNDIDIFLRETSGTHDFAKLAQLPATSQNLEMFLRLGEDDQWPLNWQEYPNPSGQVARSATELRDRWLISAPPGVYFVGCGHLRDLLAMEDNGNPEMIGGEGC